MLSSAYDRPMTVPVAPVRPSWPSALSAYETARARSEAFPDEAEEAEDAVELWCAAQDHLVLEVPAPDGTAFLKKLDLTRERWTDFAIPNDWLDALRCDAERLLKVASA